MGCNSGKLTFSLDDKVKLEILKNKDDEYSIQLGNLLENRDKFTKKDKKYITDETVKYLKNIK